MDELAHGENHMFWALYANLDPIFTKQRGSFVPTFQLSLTQTQRDYQ